MTKDRSSLTATESHDETPQTKNIEVWVRGKGMVVYSPR